MQQAVVITTCASYDRACFSTFTCVSFVRTAKAFVAQSLDFNKIRSLLHWQFLKFLTIMQAMTTVVTKRTSNLSLIN